MLQSRVLSGPAMAALTLLGTTVQAGELGSYTSGRDGFDTHTYYYDDGQEVTVFDTQFTPELAREMVDQIRSETDSPITRVVITHPNPDKFNAVSVFHELGATSIASQATAEAMPDVHAYKEYFFTEVAGMFEPDGYPELAPLDETFTGKRQIELASGETITLFELEHSGISSTQTVARIDAGGDLLVGDLVHHDAHAWLEGGIVDGQPQPDLDAWKQALRELGQLGEERVHGGRGAFDVPVDEAVSQQMAYLDGVGKEVDHYISEHKDLATALRDPETAQTHYEALQERLAQRFPDHDLVYLISAGIYGLLKAKVREVEG